MDCPHGLRAYAFPPPTLPSASLPAQSVQAISVAGKPVDVWRHCPLCTWVTCKSGADNEPMTRQSRKQPALDCWSAHKLARRTTNILKDKKKTNNALSGVFILKDFEWLFSEQSWNDRDFHSAGGYITGKVCLHYSFLLLSSVLLLLSIHFSVCLFFAITWWVTSFRIVWKGSCFKMNLSNQLPRWHLAKNKQTTRISMW